MHYKTIKLAEEYVICYNFFSSPPNSPLLFDYDPKMSLVIKPTTPFFIRPWVDVFRLGFRELRDIKMWSKSERKIITNNRASAKRSFHHYRYSNSQNEKHEKSSING